MLQLAFYVTNHPEAGGLKHCLAMVLLAGLSGTVPLLHVVSVLTTHEAAVDLRRVLSADQCSSRRPLPLFHISVCPESGPKQ